MSRSRVINLSNFPQFTAINVLSDPGAMGGPVIIPNAAKMMIVWQLTDGKIARNVLGLQVAAAWTATAAEAEAARAALVSGAAWTALAAHIAPTTSLLRVELVDIRTQGQPVVASTGAASPGTSSGTALPDEVAVAVTLRTNRVGTGFRGRYYVPGWATTALGVGNVVLAAAVTALQNWTVNVSNAAVQAGGVLVLLQPARQAYTGSTGTQHPARQAGVVTITQQQVRNNTWDSQRRRGLK